MEIIIKPTAEAAQKEAARILAAQILRQPDIPPQILPEDFKVHLTGARESGVIHRPRQFLERRALMRQPAGPCLLRDVIQQMIVTMIDQSSLLHGPLPQSNLEMLAEVRIQLGVLGVLRAGAPEAGD